MLPLVPSLDWVLMAKHRHNAVSREVASKSEAQIERETAHKWAERAEVCYDRYRTTGRKSWQQRAESYRHEALEHAALVGDGGKLVGVLERRLAKWRT